MRRIATLLLTFVAAAGCADETPTAPAPETRAAEARTGPAGLARYQITFENLTAGQPFTPPAVAIHRPAISLFEVGEPANGAIQAIAENGDLGPAVELLSASRQVSDFGAAFGPTAPPLLPGETTSIELESLRGAKLLSFAAMLICTNDGFTGLSNVRLPRRIGEEIVLYGVGYDAGTERNTEDFADIVPPCQGLVGISSDDAGTGMTNPDLAENDVIRIHPEIRGDDDLVPSVHGWNDPVVRVAITRID